MTTTFLAANGALMRDLESSLNMQKAGGIFVRGDRAGAHCRLWSVNDCHPGMIRVDEGGTHIDVETWQSPPVSFTALLMDEPAGLATGKIRLADSGEVLGVLTENWLTEGQREITELGSWHKYTGHFHAV